jgi:hypothetical protein
MKARFPRSIVAAQHAVPVLLLLASAILAFECAATRIAKDYSFDVTGVVASEDGAPVKGARIPLDLSGPVFEGIGLVKTRHVQTDHTGGFAFGYLTDERGAKYAITIPEQGFKPESISGTAPAPGGHTISLKKAGEPPQSPGGAPR